MCYEGLESCDVHVKENDGMRANFESWQGLSASGVLPTSCFVFKFMNWVSLQEKRQEADSVIILFVHEDWFDVGLGAFRLHGQK